MEESKLIEKNYSNLSIERERETVIKKWNGTGANGIIWKLFNYLITKFNKRVREFFRKYLEVSYNFLKHRDIQEVKMKN